MSKISSMVQHIHLFIVISLLVGKDELCVMPHQQFAVES